MKKKEKRVNLKERKKKRVNIVYGYLFFSDINLVVFVSFNFLI